MKEEILKQRFKESKSRLVIGPLLMNKVSIVSKLCTVTTGLVQCLFTVSMNTKAEGFCLPCL